MEELYSSPMPEFTVRRKTLAAAAKKAGDKDLAVQIAGLRKPTVAADTVNRLVRAAPDEVEELLALGAELRKAEQALNGPAMRELSGKRRQLVNDLTRLAFEITDQSAPSAAIREEVSSTLNAALADENIADMLMSGALVTQARWDGFGSTSLPELAAVLPLDPNRRRKSARPETTGPDGPDDAKPKAKAAATVSEARAVPKTPIEPDQGRATKAAKAQAERAEAQAERAEAERAKAAQEAKNREERERAAAEQSRRLEAARSEARAAQDAADRAHSELQDIDRRISELNVQLAHQRKLLAQAQRTVREADSRQRAAQLALTRAGGSASR